MTINVWLALRDDAQAQIKTRLQWDTELQGAYTGPVSNRQHRLFQLMHDQATVEHLFRIDRVSARDWHLWNLTFDFPNNVLQRVKDELDALIAAYPSHVKIVGAWNWDDGTQVEQAGSPVYPIHARILELMPDVVTYDINGNETSRTRPLVPSDVNLGFGQAPRQF